MKAIPAIVTGILFWLFIFGALAASPYDLTRLKPSQIAMKGQYGDDKTDVTYSVQTSSCDTKQCLLIVWDSSIKKIQAWIWPDGSPFRTIYEKLKSKERVEIQYGGTGASYRYTKDGKTENTAVEEKGLGEALVIDVLLLAYPFEKPREITMPIIDADSDDGDTYTMFAKLDDEEEITVGGQKTQAYKIKVGITGVSGWFAPTYYFWYSKDRPHRYLQYLGPEEKFFLVNGELALP